MLALSTIALLSIATQFGVQRSLADQESDGAVINLAGRQRMLSQRIAKNVTRAILARAEGEPVGPHVEELRAAMSQWCEAHERLVHGDPESASEGVPAPTDPAVIAAYEALQDPFDRLKRAAQAVMASCDQGSELSRAEQTATLAELSSAEAAFLTQMHAIVGLHEAEARARVQLVENIEFALFFVTLLVLLLEAMLVFEPAARALRAQMNALRETAQKAERSAAAKGEFLANISHEIRTPMTAIFGYSDLLLEPGINPWERTEHAWIIRRSAEQLLHLVNEVLDASKLADGKVEVEEIPYSPAEVAWDCHSMLAIRANERNIDFRMNVEEGVPPTALGDPARIRQVLINLAGNAIKFTEAGFVELKVRIAGGADGERRLEYLVEDSGIGIDEQKLATIFEAFSQADTSITRRFGGTGLGLSISSQLAELMGGAVSVTSEVGVGSAFTLSLPIHGQFSFEPANTVEMDAPHTGAGGVLAGSRILLVEDGFDNQRLIAFHLTRAGAHVDLANNGKKAIEAVHETIGQSQPYDVILMDLQMPVLDGLQATTILRDSGYTGRIIALTAFATADARRQASAAGCDAHLAKPVDVSDLITACRTPNASRTSEADSSPPTTAESSFASGPTD